MNRAFALVRAIVVAAIFVSIWTWFFPRWFAMGKGVALVPRWSVAAVVLMVIGGTIMVKCVWDFAWSGRGTPMPLDPPRRLVVNGFYRFVRNPMYVGMGVFLIGEALLLPAITREMLIMTLVLWIAVQILILAYEEPTLRRSFGEDYERYCKNVRRWIPRLTPYSPAPGSGAGPGVVTSRYLE